MQILNYIVQCLLPRKEIDETLQKKRKQIVSTAMNWYDAKDLPDLKARRQTWFILQRSVSFTRSEIYCRVIQKIKLDSWENSNLVLLTFDKLNLPKKLSGKKYLEKYFSEIKMAIQENNSTHLHPDYQTTAISEQIRYLNQLTTDKSGQICSSERKDQFVIAKIEYNFEQSNQAASPSIKKHYLLNAKDAILQAASSNQQLDKETLREYVYQLLLKYLMFRDISGKVEILLTEIYEILKDVNLGGRLTPEVRTEFTIFAIKWLINKHKKISEFDERLAFTMIYDDDLIQNQIFKGVQERTITQEFKNSSCSDTEKVISQNENRLNCLKYLLCQALLLHIEECNKMDMLISEDFALKILNLLNNKDNSENYFKHAVNRLFNNAKKKSTIRELLSKYKSLITDDCIISKLDTTNLTIQSRLNIIHHFGID